VASDSFQSGTRRFDPAENVIFPHAARDQLVVLRAEINDDDHGFNPSPVTHTIRNNYRLR
jgi:hypothetical protein